MKLCVDVSVGVLNFCISGALFTLLVLLFVMTTMMLVFVVAGLNSESSGVVVLVRSGLWVGGGAEQQKQVSLFLLALRPFLQFLQWIKMVCVVFFLQMANSILTFWRIIRKMACIERLVDC